MTPVPPTERPSASRSRGNGVIQQLFWVLLLPVRAALSSTGIQSRSACEQTIIGAAAGLTALWLVLVSFRSSSNDVLTNDGNQVRGFESTSRTKNKTSSARSFQYLGDIDPAVPRPWDKSETDWWATHAALVKRVSESDALPPQIITEGGNEDDENSSTNEWLPQLVFYGDSITEGFEGLSFGNVPGPTRKWGPDEPDAIRATFRKHFGEDSAWGGVFAVGDRKALRPPLLLGIAGSKTYDLLWRMMDGEYPRTPPSIFVANNTLDNPKELTLTSQQSLQRIYVVLIGTNNLGGGQLPDQTLRGIDAVGRSLLQQGKNSYHHGPIAILLSEILPRRDNFRAVKMCPPRCKNVETKEPYTSFGPAIRKVNDGLPGVVKGWKKDYPEGRMLLLSSRFPGEDSGGNGDGDGNDALNSVVHQCNEGLFAFDDDETFDAYMPDRLHPNAIGYDHWAKCLEDGLAVLMGQSV